MAKLGIMRIEQTQSPTTQRGRTQESEPTTGKQANDLDVTASPCRIGDSQYNTMQFTLFDLFIIRTFITTRALMSP